MPKAPSIKVGDVFRTNGSGLCRVIRYENAHNVYVRFMEHDEIVLRTLAGSLKHGRVENPYKPSLYGRGFRGQGKYHGSRHKYLYNRWAEMFRRCYDPTFQQNNPTYQGCRVVKSWYNFQNFCAWAEHQPNCATKGYCLDKDLRVFGNKTYGPKFCSFVPEHVNLVLGGSVVGKSKYPGVWYDRACHKPYWVRYENITYRFSEARDAYKFHLGVKLKTLRRLAKQHKRNLHPDVYASLTTLDKRSLSKVLFLFYKQRRSV